jgi:hypothetical protein
MSLDIVYVCRPGDDNEELRYSLRSLRNLPHGKVWIAGYCPSWVSDEVGRIPVPQMASKHQHALASLIAAMDHPEVSDPFLLFNDDFYVMQPMDRIPVLHNGPLEKVIEEHAKSTYREAMEKTAEVLRNTALAVEPFYGYEIHCPMEFEKLALGLILTLGQKVSRYQYRTVYGNYRKTEYGDSGTQCSDIKVYRSTKGHDYRNWSLLSTSDRTFKFHPVGRYIREQFSEVSPYEKAIPQRQRAGSRYSSHGAVRYTSVVTTPH